MSGSKSDEDDLVLLVCLMDSFVRKIRRQLRIPKYVSVFSGDERMSKLISRHEGLLLEQIMMNWDCFTRLYTLFMFQNYIQEAHTLIVQEQLMIFITMVAYGDNSRRSAYEWNHSIETISRYFDVLCSHLVDLATQFIVRPDFNDMPPVIATNSIFYPHFQVCGLCY